MPDIGSLHTFAAGTALNAEEVMENLYDPKESSPTSLEAINGQLDADNLPGGSFVSNEMVRPSSMCRAEMTGSTGNLDFHSMLFPNDAEDSGAFIAIPGASKSFYLPIDPEVVIFTWQITLGNTILYAKEDAIRSLGENELPRCQLQVHLNGVTLVAQERQVPHACDVHGEYSTTNGSKFDSGHETPVFRHDVIRHKHRDRTWSGHSVSLKSAGEGLSAGWHNVKLSLWTNDALTRIRVRNIKVIWFK